jgi:hypothetical protein
MKISDLFAILTPQEKRELSVLLQNENRPKTLIHDFIINNNLPVKVQSTLLKARFSHMEDLTEEYLSGLPLCGKKTIHDLKEFWDFENKIPK